MNRIPAVIIIALAVAATPVAAEPAVITEILVTAGDEGAAEPYGRGTRLFIQLTTSEPVSVVGSPTLLLQVGERRRRAAFAYPTTRTRYIFQYDVQPADLALDGIRIGTDPWSGGGVVDSSGAAVDLRPGPSVKVRSRAVDGRRSSPPTVVQVEILSAPEEGREAYGIGETLRFLASFDKPVVVDPSQPPSWNFRLGQEERAAGWYRDLGADTTVAFAYTVRDGEEADTVTVAATGLRPGGIRDHDGNLPAIPRRSSVLVGHGVDGRPPEIEVVGFAERPSGRRWLTGETVPVDVEFNEPVRLRPAPGRRSGPCLRLQIGERERCASWTAVAGYSSRQRFEYRLDADDEDNDGIAIRSDALDPGDWEVEDRAGNRAIVDLGRQAIADHPHHTVVSTGRAGRQRPPARLVQAAGSPVRPAIRRARLPPTPVAGPADDQGPVIQDVTMRAEPGRDGVIYPGSSLRFTIRFSEKIHLRPGRPRPPELPSLRVLVGDQERIADLTLASASESDTGKVLTFSVLIIESDEAPHGVVLPADALQANGWEISDDVGNQADLGHPGRSWSENPVSATRLVRSDARVVLRPGDGVDRPVVADEVVIDSPVRTDQRVVIVANQVTFNEGGEISAPAVVVFARRVSFGRMNASGRPARGRRGRNGGDGGALFIAADRIEGTELDVSGGDGAPGARGRRGRDGVDGVCTSWFGLSRLFGGPKWRDATSGQDGGRGGPGGNGGRGGQLTLFTRPGGERTLGEVDINGGRPGGAGPGGLGGRGGRGCSPLVHIATNPPQPNGASGGAGRAGARGRNGKLDLFDGFDARHVGHFLDQVDLTKLQDILHTGRRLVPLPTPPVTPEGPEMP